MPLRFGTSNREIYADALGACTLQRRQLLTRCAGAGALLFAVNDKAFAQQPANSFAEKFAAALNQTAQIDDAKQIREGLADEYDFYSSRAFAPRLPKATVPISDDAVKLLVLFEVTDAHRYSARYQSPVWPKGQSGATIGVGYDLGYVTTTWLNEDWGSYLTPAQLSQLSSACGIKGSAAKAAARQLHKIVIPWETADHQFRHELVPRWTAETLKNLPNSADLSPDCLGSMVSLVYNRGASFKLPGERRREMRAIRLHMVNREFAKIPAELRQMKRLWAGNKDMAGLVIRRELEASLFEAGIQSTNV